MLLALRCPNRGLSFACHLLFQGAAGEAHQAHGRAPGMQDAPFCMRPRG